MIMFKSTYLAKHHHLSSVVYILCFVSAYLGVWFCWWGICFSLSLLDCPLLHQLRCYYKSSIFFCHLKRGFFFFFFFCVGSFASIEIVAGKNHRPAKLAKFASFLKVVGVLGSRVMIIFQIIFYTKMHDNDIFLFLKNYF